MIARSIFWKRFKKLIFGSFAIVFGIITCCLLGSWTIDNNGNLVGSNLLESYNISGDMYNASLRLNASFNANSTYTLSFPNDIESNLTTTNISSVANSGWRHRTYVTFTITNSNQTYVILTFQGGSSGNNLLLKLQNQSFYMLNEGSTIEEFEPYGVWYSQNNYDIALNNSYSFYYNVFNNSYQFIYANDNMLYGDGSINTLYRVYREGPNADIVHIYNNLSTDISSFKLYSWDTSFMQDFFDNHQRGTMLFILNTFINYPLYISLDDITFNYNIQVLYQDMSTAIINTDTIQPSLYFAKLDSSFDNPIIAFAFDYYTADYVLANQKVSIDTAGLNLNDYYQRGYDSAKSYYGATVQQQLRDIEDLNSQIDTLNNTIDSWISRYNNLANQSTELSMRNLMWYIASTPFESFKSIWNVDFLGLNISAFFTGMFSIFIIIWILKKIF